MLLANYITSAWRNILRHKLFSIINILGLAIGLAAVMLIALYVRYETSYDNFWKNADNIYRVQIEYDPPNMELARFAQVPPVMLNSLITDFPQIENAVRIMPQKPTIKSGEEYYQEDVQFVDQSLTKILDFNILQGNMKSALNNNASIALSKSSADKFFGTKNPIGQLFTIEFSQFTRDYKIAAVFEDIPENSMLDLNIILLIDENDWLDVPLFNGWLAPASFIYFTLPVNSQIDDINRAMSNFIDKNLIAFSEFPEKKRSEIVTIKALNIKDLYLYAEGSREIRERGNMSTIIIFSSISILILIIAAINFTNLSTARAGIRAKEISMRKTLGANRQDLIRQFLGESVFLTLLSLLIALCMVEVTLPHYNIFLDKKMMIDYLSLDMLVILSTAIAIGIIAGIYPSIILSSFRPANILKSSHSNETNISNTLRKYLVITQFSTSITLFIATAVVYGQMEYVRNLDLGYEEDNLIIIKTNNHNEINEKALSFIDQIKQQPNIINASDSSHLPASTEEYPAYFYTPEMGFKNPLFINVRVVGYDFFETYAINMIRGREYNVNRPDAPPTESEILDGDIHKGALILNQSAVRRFEFGSPQQAIGKEIYQTRNGKAATFEVGFEVVGIVPDVHFDSLKKEVQPEVYVLNWGYSEAEWTMIRSISVRYIGDPINAIEDIRTIWQQNYPSINLNYEFAVDRVMKQYVAEKNELTMFTVFSGLAIFIACLGLFGLASFTAERRTKEIGIRKVFGAEVWQIVKLLVWQFSKPVLIANIIAWPIAYLAMSRWLESFVYRIDDMVIIALCLIAGLTALLIAWATVAANSYAVARQNPIKVLRCE